MIAHDTRHGNEAAIFALRTEAGLQEMRKWLFWKRDEISDKFMEFGMDDLPKMQGEARLVKRLIRMIDHGPQIKGVA